MPKGRASRHTRSPFARQIHRVVGERQNVHRVVGRNAVQQNVPRTAAPLANVERPGPGIDVAPVPAGARVRFEGFERFRDQDRIFVVLLEAEGVQRVAECLLKSPSAARRMRTLATN